MLAAERLSGSTRSRLQWQTSGWCRRSSEALATLEPWQSSGEAVAQPQQPHQLRASDAHHSSAQPVCLALLIDKVSLIPLGCPWHLLQCCARSVFYLPPPKPLNYLVQDLYGGPCMVLQGALDPLNDARARAVALDAACSNVEVQLIDGGHCPVIRPSPCLALHATIASIISSATRGVRHLYV